MSNNREKKTIELSLYAFRVVWFCDLYYCCVFVCFVTYFTLIRFSVIPVPDFSQIHYLLLQPFSQTEQTISLQTG